MERNVQPIRDLLRDVEPEPNFSKLDGADVGTVYLPARRERLLRKIPFLSAPPDDAAKRFADFGFHAP